MILLPRTRERPALCRKNLPARHDSVAPEQNITCLSAGLLRSDGGC